MYLHCVNLKEVLSQNEVVYSLSDGEEKIYYTPGRINTDYIYSEELSFIKYEDEVKLEMFKNYREKLKGILEDCKNNYNYIEPYTFKMMNFESGGISIIIQMNICYIKIKNKL